MRRGASGAPAWERVLVRLPNWVGDVIMATPALHALRHALPGAHLAVALKNYVVPVLQGSDDVDEILSIPDRGERLVRGAWRFSRVVNRGRYDAAILLTNSLTSAIPLAMAGVPERIGYTGDWRGPLLTRGCDPARVDGRRVPVPMTRYYLDLLASVGIPDAGAAYRLPIGAPERADATRVLRGLGHTPGRPLAAINPGARFGASKLWLPERFSAVARALVDRGFQVLVLCGPGEEAIAREIASGAGPGILDSSRASIALATLKAVMEAVDLLVTTDTGPRHMATALGKPTVVVMGSTHPEWTAWNLERAEIVRHEVPCGPCHLRVCPLDHRCMTEVSVSEVLDAVDRVLATPARDA